MDTIAATGAIVKSVRVLSNDETRPLVLLTLKANVLSQAEIKDEPAAGSSFR